MNTRPEVGDWLLLPKGAVYFRWAKGELEEAWGASAAPADVLVQVADVSLGRYEAAIAVFWNGKEGANRCAFSCDMDAPADTELLALLEGDILFGGEL